MCKGPEVKKHDVLGPVSQLNHSDKLINDHKNSSRVAWLKPSGTNDSPFHRGERLLMNSASHRASWRAAKVSGYWATKRLISGKTGVPLLECNYKVHRAEPSQADLATGY